MPYEKYLSKTHYTPIHIYRKNLAFLYFFLFCWQKKLPIQSQCMEYITSLWIKNKKWWHNKEKLLWMFMNLTRTFTDFERKQKKKREKHFNIFFFYFLVYEFGTVNRYFATKQIYVFLRVIFEQLFHRKFLMWYKGR